MLNEKTLARRYICVHFGKTLLCRGASFLSLFVMIRYLDLPASLAGVIFLLGALANALADTAVGYVRSRIAATQPTIDHGLLALVAIAFGALPLIAPGMPGLVLAAIILFRIAFAWADVSHNALTSRIAPTPEDALPLSRARTLWSSVATLLIGAIAFPVMAQDALPMAELAALFAAIALLGWLFMLPLPGLLAGGAISGVPALVNPVRRGRRGALADRRLVGLVLTASVVGIGLSALTKALPHLDAGLYAWAAASIMLVNGGRLLVSAGWGHIAPRLGGSALSASLLLTAFLVGVMPWALALQPIALLCLVLVGCGTGVIGIVIWYAFTRTVQELVQPQDHALAFGLFTTCIKLATGLGGMTAGLWIDAAGSDRLHASTLTTGLVMVSASLAAAALLCLAHSQLGSRWSASIRLTGRLHN
ncbi:MAG: hypothetical protein ACREB5_03395 [Sphingomonadaceae bacterium]